MLTSRQIIRATIDAQELVIELAEAGAYERADAPQHRRQSASDDIARRLRKLAAELGYRIEPINPATVLKLELVESLAGRSEPSAELRAMREAL